MFSAIKIINSKNKKNIRFVAAGSYQIEFFECEGSEYFTIYRFSHGGEGGAHYHLINLGVSSIAPASGTDFQIIQGSSTYKLRIIENGNKTKVYVTRNLWGWLPLSRFGGEVSTAGLSTLKATLGKYATDLAA